MEKFSLSTQHSFLDYLTGGCELNFMVAIDFTGIHLCNQLVYFTLEFLPADRIIFSFFIKIKCEMHFVISFWALQVRLTFIAYPKTLSSVAFYSFQHPCFSYAYFVDIFS